MTKPRLTFLCITVYELLAGLALAFVLAQFIPKPYPADATPYLLLVWIGSSIALMILRVRVRDELTWRQVWQRAKEENDTHRREIAIIKAKFGKAIIIRKDYICHSGVCNHRVYF